MTMQATVSRPAASGIKDPYGGIKVLERETVEVPCFWWEQAVTEIEDGRKITRLAVSKMMVPLGAAISEGDRVTAVSDRRGQAIRVGQWDVTGIIRHPGYLEVLLEATR